jgi:undecaprenyl pyrophosphate phosphatase UppP
MDLQTLINIGAAAILTVVGWFARQLWDAVDKLKNDVKSGRMIWNVGLIG